jgi:hypothetical protein
VRFGDAGYQILRSPPPKQFEDDDDDENDGLCKCLASARIYLPRGGLSSARVPSAA